MTRNKKFDEPSRVLTIRVPSSRYEEFKKRFLNIIEPNKENIQKIELAQILGEQAKKYYEIFKALPIEKKEKQIREIEKVRLRKIVTMGARISQVFRKYNNIDFSKLNIHDYYHLGNTPKGNLSWKLLKHYTIPEIINMSKQMLKFIEKEQMKYAESKLLHIITKYQSKYHNETDKIYIFLFKIKQAEEPNYKYSIRELKEMLTQKTQISNNNINFKQIKKRLAFCEKSEVKYKKLITDSINRRLSLRDYHEDITKCLKHIDFLNNTINKRNRYINKLKKNTFKV